MNIRYSKVFDIRCLHLYYASRSSSDLSLTPTAPTLRMLSKYRLIVRQLKDGIVVLAPVVGKPAKLQFPIGLAEGFKLVFKVEPKNPHFLNLTDLALKKPPISYLRPLKTGYYFSNLQNNPLHLTSPDQDLKLLSKKNASPASDEDRLPYWTPSLRVHLAPPSNSLDYKIKDLSNTEVFSEVINTPAPFSEYAPEKPPSLNPGIYKLTKDGSPEQRVYIDENIYHKPPFGLIEIFHNTDVPDNYKIISIGTENTPNPQSYHLLFESRSTFWRYQFPRGISGILSVKKGATNFVQKPAEKLFQSPDLIKMTDEYQTVQLTRTTGNENIPNPSVDSLKIDPVSKKVYADVYL